MSPSPPEIQHLRKQKSWSPDLAREEAWRRKKNLSILRCVRCKSVTYEDLEELKASMELGFDFDSPEIDQKLHDVFPALGLYQSVNRQYQQTLSRSSSISSMVSDNDSEASSMSIYDPGDEEETVKTRLKQWAQAVAVLSRTNSVVKKKQ